MKRLTAGLLALMLLATLLPGCGKKEQWNVDNFFLSDDGKVDTALTTALSFMLLPAILFYGMTALLTAMTPGLPTSST